MNATNCKFGTMASKKLVEGLVLKSEKVKEGRGTKYGWITSADVARLSLQELHILWPVQGDISSELYGD